MSEVNYLMEQLKQQDIHVTDEQAAQLMKYYQLLLEWNKVMNLTAITEFPEVVKKHFIDSLLILKSMDMSKVKTLVDIGTGAGFPGIPIKIMYPEMTVLLVDSLQKRVRFLNTIIEELGLRQIEAIHGRAEELAGKEAYREQYDLCVSRAVAKLVSLSELCIPFVKRDGYFVAYKSLKAEEELVEAARAIKLLGGVQKKTDVYQLGEEESRSLIVIKKIKLTEKKYPRAGGKPIKEPLLS